jgi:uncharacterized membrane protein YeaQ/YmgE (transglycosylase-associated protein family)
MFIALPGTVFIAIIIGYFSEKSGFTRNGYMYSIVICVGGAMLFFWIRALFGFSFGSHGVNAIISSVGSLVIVPTHFRRK